MALTQISDSGLKTPASDLQDNEKIVIGTGNDLEIFHDGSNSVIKEAGTGDLRIQTASFRLRNEDASEMMISADADGAVYLAHNGNTKLETASNGVTITGNCWADAFYLGDNEKSYWGIGDDLQIYHDGSDSIIHQDGTGDLRIRSDNSLEFNTGGEENAIWCDANGAVKLYYDNSKKFETTSGGVHVTGYVQTGNGTWGLLANDSNKIGLGTDQDLQIYHDGTNNYIDAVNNHVTIIKSGTSDLLLQGNPVWITDEGNSHTYFKGSSGGAAELYYDGTLRLATASSGADVTGRLYVSDYIQAADHILLADSKKVQFGAGNDLQIYHDGSHSKIVDAGTGDLKIQTNSLQLLNAAGDEYFLSGVENGAVEIYYNNGVRIATSVDGADLRGTTNRCEGHFRPWNNDTYDLGTSSDKWDDVYATNGTIQTSDRNEKESITATDLGLAFVNKLTPVSFKHKGKTRTHYGLVAQDIETVITDLGKNTTQFAPLIKEDVSEKKDGSDIRYGLRYSELISPLIKAIQELSTKVAALEAA